VLSENSFSKWVCESAKKMGYIPQRLEVTTGAGIPDLVLMGEGRTIWLELKWETRFIRAEQYVWLRRIRQEKIPSGVLVGENDRIMLYSVDEAEPFPKTKRYKVRHELGSFPRTLAGFHSFLLLTPL